MEGIEEVAWTVWSYWGNLWRLNLLRLRKLIIRNLGGRSCRSHCLEWRSRWCLFGERERRISGLGWEGVAIDATEYDVGVNVFVLHFDRHDVLF